MGVRDINKYGRPIGMHEEPPNAELAHSWYRSVEDASKLLISRDPLVAHALLRAVFALLRTPLFGKHPGVHRSVNAACKSACATGGFILFGVPAGPRSLRLR